MQKSTAHWTSALVGAALAATTLYARADHEEPKVVRDLAYGEVLFHYFKGDHFSALTRLLAGLERDELPSHAHDADLLLGALYLSYGQHRLAAIKRYVKQTNRSVWEKASVPVIFVITDPRVGFATPHASGEKARSVSALCTAPVGLAGEPTTIAQVRGESAARTASGSSA